MTGNEIAAALIALCVGVLVYLIGERIRSDRTLAAYRWGDPQRHAEELAWWASDGACIVYVAFAWAILYRLFLK